MSVQDPSEDIWTLIFYKASQMHTHLINLENYRILNKSSKLVAVGVSVINGGSAFDKMDMSSIADINGRPGAILYFVEMVF